MRLVLVLVFSLGFAGCASVHRALPWERPNDLTARNAAEAAVVDCAQSYARDRLDSAASASEVGEAAASACTEQEERYAVEYAQSYGPKFYPWESVNLRQVGRHSAAEVARQAAFRVIVEQRKATH